MTRNIVFPAFNPFNNQVASRLSICERRFSDRSFIKCFLGFDRDPLYHIFAPAGKLAGRGKGETFIGFDFAMSPSWYFYHQRPFPFNDIWIGARVIVEFGIEEESEGNPSTNRPPTGTGCAGVITGISGGEYMVQYDEPQGDSLTYLGYGRMEAGEFHPFQLKLQTESSQSEQYFYEWLSAVTERACEPNKKETIDNFVDNWLAQDGGKLMRRIYEDVPDDDEITGSIGWYMGDAKTANERAALLKEWFNE